MNLQISGKNMDLTEALKQYIQNKIEPLNKYNSNIIEAHVTVEPVRDQHAESFNVAAKLHVGHEELYTEEIHTNAYAAVDIVHDELERQLHDLKERFATAQRKSAQTTRNLKSAV